MKRPEQALHISAVAFMRRALPPNVVFLHPANGGRRTKAEAALFKAMGVTAGAPDLIFIMPNAQAAFMEFKAPKGALSGEQIDFRQRVIANGCGYAEVRTMEEVEATLIRWLAAYQLTLRARLARPGALEGRAA